MTQGEVKTLKQTGADRQSQFLQSLSPAADVVDQGVQTPFPFLFDHLAIDQIRMRLLDRLPGAPRLSRASKGFQAMVDFDQRVEVAAEPIAEKARHAQDHLGRHLNELQGAFKRPWADKRRQDKTEIPGQN